MTQNPTAVDPGDGLYPKFRTHAAWVDLDSDKMWVYRIRDDNVTSTVAYNDIDVGLFLADQDTTNQVKMNDEFLQPQNGQFGNFFGPQLALGPGTMPCFHS
jgi:hypothetical protein